MNIAQIGLFDGNAGDIVLTQVFRALIGKFQDNINWDLVNVRDEVNQEYINRLNKADKIIFSGGGLFLPDSNQNKISGWQWACSKEMLDKIEKPIYAFALGYNYFYGQIPNDLFIENLKYFIDKCEFFSVRSNGDKIAIIKLIGDEYKNKIKIQPCSTVLISKIYDIEKKRNNNLCINIAYDRSNLRYGKSKVKVINEIVEAIRILSKKFKITVFGHLNTDMNFYNLLLRKKIKCNKINFRKVIFPNILKHYGNTDIMIGTRGHSLLIPFGLNKLVIGFDSHPKIRWFFEDIEQPELCIDKKNIRKKIVNRVNMLHNDYEKYLKKNEKKQNEFWKITKKNIEIIFPKEILNKIIEETKRNIEEAEQNEIKEIEKQKEKELNDILTKENIEIIENMEEI